MLFIFLSFISYAQVTLKVVDVVSVYDGDTFKAIIDCDCEMDIFCKNIDIRVLGIDAPEIKGNCEKERN